MHAAASLLAADGFSCKHSCTIIMIARNVHVTAEIVELIAFNLPSDWKQGKAARCNCRDC